MEVHKGLHRVPPITRPVLTIGTFDGVHAAHQRIIERVKESARSIGGTSVLLTFSPHPRHVLSPRPEEVPLITTLDEQQKLLEYFGIEHLIIVPFTRQFSQKSPLDFIREVLVRHIHPEKIVIGYDHRFGKDREGDINLLQQVSSDFGFKVEEIPEQIVDEVAVSSTKVRRALQQGDVKRASQQLNHYFTLHGTVVKGDQKGKKLGVPTANLQINEDYKLIPAEGVYAVKVNHQENIYNGVLNIGTRPTFNGTEQRIEVHIFDFQQQIYGNALGVYFIERIRDDEKFESEEDLVEAMKEDIQTARSILQQKIELIP